MSAPVSTSDAAAPIAAAAGRLATAARPRVNLAAARPRRPAASAATATTKEDDESEEDANKGDHAPSAAAASVGSTQQNVAPPSAAVAPAAPPAVVSSKVTSAFPKSKIKQLMQLDEDIHNMSEVVPLMVSKCLELFIGEIVSSLQTHAAADTERVVRGKHTIITAQHIKQLVQLDPKYDFLVDIVANVPDTDPDQLQAGEKKRGSAKKTTAAAASTTKAKPKPKGKQVKTADSSEKEEEDDDGEDGSDDDVVEDEPPSKKAKIDTPAEAAPDSTQFAGF